MGSVLKLPLARGATLAVAFVRDNFEDRRGAHQNIDDPRDCHLLSSEPHPNVPGKESDQEPVQAPNY